ncbi:MAG: META domain-containing protein [Pseudomonadales bacterium]
MRIASLPLLLLTALLVGVAGCQSQPANNKLTLENNYWKLVELHGKPVAVIDNQTEPHLILHADKKRVAGSGGCNRIMGSYTANTDTVQFKQMASTMMACAQGMDTEQIFLRSLEGEQRWRTTRDTLILTDKQGKVFARFSVIFLR